VREGKKKRKNSKNGFDAVSKAMEKGVLQGMTERRKKQLSDQPMVDTRKVKGWEIDSPADGEWLSEKLRGNFKDSKWKEFGLKSETCNEEIMTRRRT